MALAFSTHIRRAGLASRVVDTKRPFPRSTDRSVRVQASPKVVVEQFMQRVNEGNIAGVVDLMADDVHTWVAGAEPWAMDAHGKDAVMKFFENIGTYFDDFTPTPTSIIAGERQAAVIGRTTAVARNSGKHVTDDWVLVFTVGEDGKVTEFRNYHDTKLVYDTLH